MTTSLDPEMKTEIEDYLSRGFFAAWIDDLEIGDIFASPRMFTFDEPRKLFVVERIIKVGQEGYDDLDEADDIRPNHVVCLIVRDEDDIQRHLAYGHTHEIYIYRIKTTP